MSTKNEQPNTKAIVREITEAEVACYQTNGWVFLKELIVPRLARELSISAQQWLKSQQADIAGINSVARCGGPSMFHTITFDKTMARNMQRLIDRKRLSGKDVEVRYCKDHYFYKPPGAPEIEFHQDSAEHAPDRCGELMLWLALEEATPEMGTMQFLSGVHREGTLGTIRGREGTGRVFEKSNSIDLLKYYPQLVTVYELSPPCSYKPGDATVHNGNMVHGSGPNVSDRPRISYVIHYSPADTRYWEGRPRGNPGGWRTLPDDGEFPVISSNN